MALELSAEQLTVARSWLGSGDDPTDAELNARWDSLQSLKAVVQEALRKRLATLVNEPAQFAIPQEYSQSTAANIAALEKQLVEISRQPDDLGVDSLNPGGTAQRVVRPDIR